MEITKQDWALFREKLPIWQERHMERLLQEYTTIANGGGSASKRFWTLKKCIEKDEHSPGVYVSRVSRSTMVETLWALLSKGIISTDDISDFSDEIKDHLQTILRVWKNPR